LNWKWLGGGGQSVCARDKHVVKTPKGEKMWGLLRVWSVEGGGGIEERGGWFGSEDRHGSWNRAAG